MSINIWLALVLGVLWMTFAYFMGVHVGRAGGRDEIALLKSHLRATESQLDTAMDGWRRDENERDECRAAMERVRCVVADSAYATITGQADDNITPVVRARDVVQALDMETWS